MATLRCINIDWLEVYCLEPINAPRNVSYFIDKGYQVKQRDYGTPIYKEMFFVIDEGHQFVEIRRNPRNIKANGGVSETGACHIRFTNRSCYLRDPVQIMQEFLLANGYTYKAISRIDICLDLQQFDNGMSPEWFVRYFMQGNIQKLNQANISAHGTDKWAERSWNSLKWGAPTSAVTTKLYNKTMELKGVKDKPYIREIWDAVGFDPDKDVWRIEFSISSESNAVIDKSSGDIIKRSLNSFRTKRDQFFQFCVYAQKYFHFKYREFTRLGNIRPKGRCRDVDILRYIGDEIFYTPTRLVWKPEGGRTEKLLARRLDAIRFDTTLGPNVREAAAFLFHHMAERYNILTYCSNLEVVMTQVAKGTPEFNKDFNTLLSIQRKWQLPDVRPRKM